MYKRVTASLTNGSQVVRELLRRFGPGQVCQVVEGAEDVFLARLRDGRMVQATVLASGALSIQELEAGA